MDYWQKQTKEEPLYPDIEWNMPEHKDKRGRLLIVGGNLHSFAAPAQAYGAALSHNIGYVRVIMPNALKKTVHTLMPEVEFTPSTVSGSLSLKSLDIILQNAQWASGLLLPGELGRNSETAVLIEQVILSTNLPLTITKDALDYITSNPEVIKSRADTLMVGSFAQIQKLATSLKHGMALTYEMPLASLVHELHQVTSAYPFSIITKVNDMFIYASKGRVATTHSPNSPEVWRLTVATKAITFWLQHTAKTFEAIAYSML